MAFFQVNMFSYTLGFPVDIDIFIPTPNSDEVLNNKISKYFTEDAKFPVMYLLHGAYGDNTDWFRLTGIEKYAALHRLAVVMPSAANSFYQDMYRGSAYLKFLTEELPQFAGKMFPISRERKDTLVAGLSMGGYGAWKIALEHPDKYSAAASLSGAIDIVSIHEMSQNDTLDGPFKWNAIFEDPDGIEGSGADLFELIRRLKEGGHTLPRLYQTVGTEDFIYPSNIAAKKKLEEFELDYTYAEHPGIHDWDFWDSHIKDVIEWFEAGKED